MEQKEVQTSFPAKKPRKILSDGFDFDDQFDKHIEQGKQRAPYRQYGMSRQDYIVGGSVIGFDQLPVQEILTTTNSYNEGELMVWLPEAKEWMLMSDLLDEIDSELPCRIIEIEKGRILRS